MGKYSSGKKYNHGVSRQGWLQTRNVSVDVKDNTIHAIVGEDWRPGKSNGLMKANLRDKSIL